MEEQQVDLEIPATDLDPVLLSDSGASRHMKRNSPNASGTSHRDAGTTRTRGGTFQR
jgi:hypothetical protein